jgi:Response regulator containing CheY-like receiver and SARP domains
MLIGTPDTEAIQAIIVDDEESNLREIADLVEGTGFMQVKKLCRNPLEALEEAAKTAPGERTPLQVAFIDIEMPQMNGIALAEKLLEKLPALRIVFITGWDRYAVQAFDLNALDYLVKPIRLERFNKMAERVRREVLEKDGAPRQRLRIRMLGRLEASIGDIPVKWQRTKASELFSYLLINHGEYVHKDTIVENLWPEYEPMKALPILQTSVCKIRSLFSGLKQQVILDYSGSCYCLVVRGADCDLFTVEQAIDSFDGESAQAVSGLLHACGLFGEGLLAQQGYLWSMERDEQLRGSLIRLLKRALAADSVRKAEQNRLDILRQIARLAPDDEEANYQFLKSLEQNGGVKELAAHCAWLDHVLRDEYDITPAFQLAELIEKYKLKI